MTRSNRLAVVVFTLAAHAALAGQHVYAQGTYFLAKQQLSAVNYRSGTALPVGTEVEVLALGADDVRCRVVSTGAEFHFVSHGSLGRSARDLFKTYFNETDPAAKVSALPLDQQQAARAGELAVGMSRQAVLLAMRPPPPNKTVSLDASKWIYWQSKLAQLEVNFDGAGKVVSFGPLGKASGPSLVSRLGGLFAKKEEAPKEVLWAKCNVRHIEGQVSWVNYQRGPVIAFNSRIEVLDKSDTTIKFRLAGEEQVFTFESDERAGKKAWPLFQNLFGPRDQSESLARLTESDRKLVRAAEVEPGMSREAVRLALGPPPPHLTPAFESNTWTYYKTKMARMRITFVKDRVESVN